MSAYCNNKIYWLRKINLSHRPHPNYIRLRTNNIRNNFLQQTVRKRKIVRFSNLKLQRSQYKRKTRIKCTRLKGFTQITLLQ